MIGQGHFAHDFLEFENLLSAEHRLHVGNERARRAQDDLPLGLAEELEESLLVKT